MHSYNNFIYSSAQNFVKIWDLETHKCKLDFSPHTGMIKMAIIPEHNAIATACDKKITIWDVNSMQKNAVKLQGHKESINCLYNTPEYLFSAGKGTNSSHSLYAWDLR